MEMASIFEKRFLVASRQCHIIIFTAPAVAKENAVSASGKKITYTEGLTYNVAVATAVNMAQ